jgi:hypothetical protein
MPTLYELSENYKNIAEMLDDPDIDQEVINGALTVVEGDLAVKGQNIAVIMRSIESDNTIIDAEIKRLKELKERNESKVTWLKNYLQENLEKIGLDKLKTPLFSVSLQKNPPALRIIDEAVIPTKYKTVVPMRFEVNKEAVKEALKAGESVAGCELTVGRSVRIR